MKRKKNTWSFPNVWKPKNAFTTPHANPFTFSYTKPTPILYTKPQDQQRYTSGRIISGFRNYDTDRDGVPDRFDCQPLNPFKQDITLDDVLKNPKLVNQLTPKQRAKLEAEYAALQKPIMTIGQYEIMKDYQDNTYYARDRKTKEIIAANRPTLKEMIRDVKSGRVKEAEEELMDVLGAKNKYDLAKKSRAHTERSKRYGRMVGQKQKRFPVIPGELVLDMGAGEAPDERATHAIDLVNPKIKFQDIKYKVGYDLNNPSIHLPYINNLFDRVVSYGALGYNFETRHLYDEIYRILIPGGKLEVSRPSGNTVSFMREAGFRVSKDSYYDPVMQRNMEVIVGTKM